MHSRNQTTTEQAPAATAKNAVFPGQHEGEQVSFVFRQHPLVMRKALILGLLAILFVILPLDFPQVYEASGLSSIIVKIDLITVVFVFIVWFYRWSLWYYTVFVVTSERTVGMVYKSYFKRDVRSLFHSSVHSVNYTVPGLQGALFGYGDIVLSSWVGDFPVTYVHHPADLHEKILEVIREHKDVGTPGPDTPSAVAHS